MPAPASLQSITLAGIEVIYLPDGVGRSDPLALFPASDPVAWSLHNKWLDPDGLTVTSLGSFLIRHPNGPILVDTGIGPVDFEVKGFGRYRGGGLLDSLASVNLAPDDIQTVFFTHLHVDHVGWALDPDTDGLRFRNARHLVHPKEWAYWQGGDDPNGPSPALQTALKEVLEPIEGGQEIAAKLQVVEAFGHTPGHCMLLFEPGGEDRLYLIGDLLYGPQQVEHDDWNPAFDVDPEGSRATRLALYPELTRYGSQTAAGHFPRSVFGQIRGMGYGRKWLPNPLP